MNRYLPTGAAAFYAQREAVLDDSPFLERAGDGQVTCWQLGCSVRSLIDIQKTLLMVEKDPSLLYLNRRLQVKCLNHNCHPTWEPGYKAAMNENPAGPSFNWQNDTLSIYWDVFPNLELDTVKYTSGLVVDAARRALKMSGVSVQELTRG